MGDRKVKSYSEEGVEAEAFAELKRRVSEFKLYRAEGFGAEGLKTLTEGWYEALKMRWIQSKPTRINPSRTHQSVEHQLENLAKSPSTLQPIAAIRDGLKRDAVTHRKFLCSF